MIFELVDLESNKEQPTTISKDIPSAKGIEIFLGIHQIISHFEPYNKNSSDGKHMHH